MNETCRILLICDDDLTGLELRRLLGDTLSSESLLNQGHRRTLALDVEEVVLSGNWEIGVHDHQYHLGIIALSGDASPMAELARHPALRGNLATVLYVVDSTITTAPLGVLRSGRDRQLALPCSRSSFMYTVERMLLAALAQRVDGSDDGRCLTLIQALITNQERTILPAFSAVDQHTWSYPLVVRHVGPDIDQVALMERLVEHGMCTRAVANRVRACPTCDCLQLIYGEACARCASVDFVRETIIHHFPCAHMDTQSAFTQGRELICPKCRLTLRQIGRDYEKPSGCYRCQSCAFISTETRIVARCLSCQTQIAPEETVERLVYAYTLTAKADAAMRAGSLHGNGMEKVLRNHQTGLFAKSFFLFSLQRELERRRRYETPVSLVIVRSTRLGTAYREGGDGYSEYVQAMWQASTNGLRTLDVPCVFEEGMLAIMLPATALAGTEVVAKRIAERFSAVRATPDATHELVITTVEAGSKHLDADALMREAIAALGPTGITTNDVLVIEDDEAATQTALRDT